MPYIMQTISPTSVSRISSPFKNEMQQQTQQNTINKVPSLRPSKKFLELIHGRDKHQMYSKRLLQKRVFATMDNIKMQFDEKQWYDGFKKRVLEYQHSKLNMTEIKMLINGKDDFIEVACNFDGLGEICYYTSVC